MSHHNAPAPEAMKAAAHETLIDGLRNAHALEKQAITVMEAQLGLLDEYPDMHAAVTAHITETREQARRLEAGLEACGASTSMIKDAFLSMMGLGQSSVQGFSDDAVLKALLANAMTEHLEVATYRSLLTLADMAGKADLRPRLEETLREEEAMAAWYDDKIDATTRRYVELMASEQKAAEKKASDKKKADATQQDNAPTPGGEAPKTPWYARDATDPSGTEPRPTADASLGTTPDSPRATTPGGGTSSR